MNEMGEENDCLVVKTGDRAAVLLCLCGEIEPPFLPVVRARPSVSKGLQRSGARLDFHRFYKALRLFLLYPNKRAIIQAKQF